MSKEIEEAVYKMMNQHAGTVAKHLTNMYASLEKEIKKPRDMNDVMEKVRAADKNSFNYEDWLDHKDIQCLLDQIKQYEIALDEIYSVAKYFKPDLVSDEIRRIIKVVR